MMLSRARMLLYVALIFGSGVLLGVFGNRLYTVNSVAATGPKNPEEWRKLYMTEMRERLHLRQDQVTQLNGILDETRSRFHEIHEKYRPEMEAMKQQQTDKIRAILDEKQRPEYEKLHAERERNAPKNGRRQSF